MSGLVPHSPAVVKAAEDTPTLQLSLKGIKGAGHLQGWNDAESS
jgi:hypothetical protein